MDADNLQRISKKYSIIMIKNTYPGKFIVVEGLDGSGKSAQVDLLVDYLKQQGKEVIVTKEPTMDSEAGRKIKQALKKEIVVEQIAYFDRRNWALCEGNCRKP